jgi:hypothetical protein
LKICFLILAHKNGPQIKTLIRTLLLCPYAHIVVHVDRKSESVFRFLAAEFETQSRVTVLEKRYKVFWGSYSQIRATLELLRESQSTGAERVCLISGQDMPVVHPAEIEEFFKKAPDREYFTSFKLPDPQWAESGMHRLLYYYFNSARFPRAVKKLNALTITMQRVTGFQRSLDFVPYGGSNWVNLTQRAVKYVLDVTDNDKGFLNRFKFTRSADEIFIQSILMNSPFAKQVENDDLRLVDWSGPEYPRIFRSEDYNRLVSAKGKLFARKFDAEVDAHIIEKLRAHVTA